MQIKTNYVVAATLWLLAGIISLAGSVSAEDSYQPVYLPVLEVSKTAGQIKIDGDLDDPGWRNAGRANNFAEHQPGDQTQPPVDTEVLITYDENNLYVAFICYDDPSTIRASFCDRDRIFSDDYVILLLDTYGDAAWAYEIMANPYGIQGDLLWSKNGGEDSSYDMIYKSAATITDAGYLVEMAIPFSGMRFPNTAEQTWKVDFWRNHPRESRRKYSWAAIDRDEPCWPCQWGTITGIKDVRPGKGIELLPAVIGYQSGALTDANDPGSAFHDEDPDGEVSISGKYSLSSNMTAEAAINPDFSQVEADAAQIDVNTTFALFYPERRPFFQEGSDLFNTYFSTFYSRSINDPQFAAKLVGRFDRTSVAYLGAYDEHTPIIIPFEESSEIIQDAGKSAVNILRARRTFGEESHIGMIVTDRRLDDGGSNTVMSADGLVELAKNYRFEWQVIGTHTEEPNDSALTADLVDVDFDGHTGAFDGESFWGHGIATSLERDARTWSFDVDYWEWSPTFRADNGFEPQNNRRLADIFSNWRFYLENDLLDWVNPSIDIGRIWNFDGVRKDEWLRVDLSAQFKVAQTNMHAQYLISNERLGGIEFANIWGIHNCMHSILSDLFSFNVSANYGHKIARNDLVMGKELGLYFAAEIKPLDRLLFEPSINYLRSNHLHTGDELFEGFIARTRINLQITRELSTRLVVQYNDFSETWDIDPLVTYRINPFSVFYAGSSYRYNNLPTDEDNFHEQWTLGSRQFFVKLQYLFQL